MHLQPLTAACRCQALCLLRQKERKEALAKALAVKDRFKGVRTKYYVLKAFASTAEVSHRSRIR